MSNPWTYTDLFIVLGPLIGGAALAVWASITHREAQTLRDIAAADVLACRLAARMVAAGRADDAIEWLNSVGRGNVIDFKRDGINGHH